MTSKRRITALLSVAATAIVLAGCGGGDGNGGAPSSAAPKAASGGGSDSITISDFKFAPADLTVRSGARISVTNDDGTAHTATADDGTSFDTGDVAPGASATISVAKAGTYAYHCTIHPFMKGTLAVR